MELSQSLSFLLSTGGGKRMQGKFKRSVKDSIGMYSTKRRPPKTVRRCVAGALILALAGATGSASAADGTKADNTVDLHSPDAWRNGIPPDAAGWGIWDSTLTSACSADLGDDATWGGVRATSAHKGTIGATSGKTLTLTGIGGVGIDLSSANADFEIGANVRLGGSQTFAVTNGRTLTVSGAIGDGANGYALTKAGPGALVLSGSNTFSGGTTLNAGTLTISNGSALGTGLFEVSPSAGGTFLTVANTAAVTLPNALALPAPATAQTYPLVKNAASQSAGTTLALAGKVSGGNTNVTLFLNSDTLGDNTTTYRFNAANTFRANINLNRGALVVGHPQGLGNAANTVFLNGNGNAALGDLRFALSMSLPNAIQMVNAVSPINTDGNDVTLLGPVSGTVPLYKLGSGALTLSANNTYSGGTIINAGKLVGVTGGACANSAVTVTSGAGNALGVSITDNKKQWSCAGLTFNSGATALDFNFGSVTPSTNLAPLRIVGNLTFNGTPAMTVTAFNLPPGTYPLFTWTGSLSGSAPTSVTLPPRAVGSLTTVGTTNYLVIAANTAPLRWALDGNGAWDIGTTQNWKDNAGTFTTYQEPSTPGDDVLFDETYISSSPVITLNGTVTPGNVLVDNASKDYTFSGGGGISGRTGLTKQGTGKLTLATTNTYGGGTVLSGGTLSVSTLANGGSPSAIGASPAAAANLSLSGGATLQYTGDSVTSDRNFTLGSGGATADVAAASQTLTLSGTVTGGYPFAKAGAGNLAFSAENALTAVGNVAVAAGDLQVGAWAWNGAKTNSILAGATFTSTGSVQIPASATRSPDDRPFGTFVAGSGTWRLRGAGASAATPDIYAPSDNFDRWGLRFTTAIDTGASGNTRHISGYSQNCNPCTRNSLHEGDLILDGSLTGAGDLHFYGTPMSATLVEMAYLLNADNSGFTGGVTLERGELFLNNSNALTAANAVSLAPGAGSNATLRVWNRSLTIGALSSTGAGTAVVAGTGPQAALTVCQNTDSAFGGQLTQKNANGGAYASGGTLSLTKDGSGALTLLGTNTYLGPTTVKAGTLRLDGAGVLGGGTYTNTVANDGIFDYRSSAAQTLSGTISGTGTVSKTGSGTLALSGANTYSGATVISGGKLVAVAGGSCANSAVTVDSGTGSALGIAVGDTAKKWSCAGLTFNAGTTALDFAFGGLTPSATQAPLTVTGNLTFAGTPTVIVRSTNLPVGTYPLVTWTGALSGSAPTVVTLSPHLAGNLTLAGSTLYLNITAASTQPLKWALSGNGTWDIGAAQNWKDSAGTATAYQETTVSGDSVVFDETYIASSPTITLNSTVCPASVTVNCATRNFAFSGSGAIAGDAGLTKQGSGTLTLSTANSYSGPTTISGGTLSVSALANGGSPSGIGASSAAAANLVIGGSATLQYTGTSATSDRGFTLGTGGGTADVSAAGQTLTLAGTVAGAYPLTKSGAGNLAFTANNALTAAGNVTIASGDLKVAAWALGNGRFLTNNATFTSTGSVQIPTFLSAGPYATHVAGSGLWRLRATGTSVGSPDIFAPCNNVNNWGIRILSPLDTGDAGTTHFICGIDQHCSPFNWAAADDGDLLLAGSLTGAGNLCFYGYPYATENMAFMLNADNSGFTGGVTLGRGDVFLNHNNALTAANAVQLASPGPGTNVALRIWNKSVTIGALSGGGSNALVSGSGPLAALTVCQSTNSTFAGTLTQQNARRVYTSSCALSFTKDGTGTLTLSATNGYTGTTTVKAGTLALGAAGTLVSTNIAIAAGATLDVTAKATYAMAANQPFVFGVNPSVPAAAGRLAAAGLDISNARVTFVVTGALTEKAYTVATYTKLTGSAFASVSGRPVCYLLEYDYNGTKQIALVRHVGLLIEVR